MWLHHKPRNQTSYFPSGPFTGWWWNGYTSTLLLRAGLRTVGFFLSMNMQLSGKVLIFSVQSSWVLFVEVSRQKAWKCLWYFFVGLCKSMATHCIYYSVFFPEWRSGWRIAGFTEKWASLIKGLFETMLLYRSAETAGRAQPHMLFLFLSIYPVCCFFFIVFLFCFVWLR